MHASLRARCCDVVNLERAPRKTLLERRFEHGWWCKAPLLVGRVICLVSSVDERDLILLNSYT